MAIIKSIFNTFILLLTLVRLSQCLFEDQIGSFDWKKSFIGRLRFASFDSVKRVVIATEENALASINLKNGHIVWRQMLESPENHRIELLYVDAEVLTVSGTGSVYYVRTWDVNAGTLLSEWSLASERPNGRWIFSKNQKQLIHVVPVLNSHLEVTHYDCKTGLNKGTTSRISTPWVASLANCAIAKTIWACLSSSSSNANLYFIDLAGDLTKVRNKLLSNFVGDVSGEVEIHEIQHSEPAILIRRNGVNRIVMLSEELKTLPYSLENSVISVSNGDQNLLMQFEYDIATQAMQLKSTDIDSNESTITDVELLSTMHPKMVAGICRGANCRALFTTNDDAVGLLQLPSGKVQWRREEALCNVLTAEFVELPLSELEASIEREFTEAASDVVSMFVKRITTQVRQLSTLLDGTQTNRHSGQVRDVFGLHKLIVLATRVGKLYAIDTISGDIVWSHHLVGTEPFRSLGKAAYLLYQQRTARHAPHSAQMTLISKLAGGDDAALYTFDPITGRTIQEQTKLTYKLKQALLMPYEDRTHLKPIVLLAENDQLHVYPPAGKQAVVDHAASTFIFNADCDRSMLQGYALHYSDGQTLRATRTWRLNLAGSTLAAVSVRPANERVHSQGRVLADRSVFYKYVNPNLIAAATVAPDAVHRHVLSVYLVDGVTGLVAYSAHHKRANGPVRMVHSENWVVYSYFSERYRRFEVTSVELYEGARQSNSTHFSSHALSQLPHPETLSYILPVNPVAMLATQTERGITNKHILIGMTSGGVLEMPWAFLEPRGPHMPSNPEEGSIPYMPELPIQAESMINYNQTLGRIQGIQVSPAKLESTSLVVVWGMDLFYTRVTPSKSFDVLKEDFDHWLIVMVLAGLTLASYVTKRLSRRKALKQMWK